MHTIHNYWSKKNAIIVSCLVGVILLYIILRGFSRDMPGYPKKLDFVQFAKLQESIRTTYRQDFQDLKRFSPNFSESQAQMRIMRQHRNSLSRQLNFMMQAYGQQSCEQLKALKAAGLDVDSRVSDSGGWCSQASNPTSEEHAWDEGFSKALSTFLEGKSVTSFGDGPGQYKKHIDSLGQVTMYAAYDGAPYCEEVTQGLVRFLDLTVPQFGLRAYDWVISVEVGEHIPAIFEDVYLDNLVRHAREGLIISWAVPGQTGLSHVNNKPLDEVVSQLNKRGFHIDKEAGEPLRNASNLPWLRFNIQVYRRTDPKLFIEDDV